MYVVLTIIYCCYSVPLRPIEVVVPDTARRARVVGGEEVGAFIATRMTMIVVMMRYTIYIHSYVLTCICSLTYVYDIRYYMHLKSHVHILYHTNMLQTIFDIFTYILYTVLLLICYTRTMISSMRCIKRSPQAALTQIRPPASALASVLPLPLPQTALVLVRWRLIPTTAWHSSHHSPC